MGVQPSPSQRTGMDPEAGAGRIRADPGAGGDRLPRRERCGRAARCRARAADGARPILDAAAGRSSADGAPHVPGGGGAGHGRRRTDPRRGARGHPSAQLVSRGRVRAGPRRGRLDRRPRGQAASRRRRRAGVDVEVPAGARGPRAVRTRDRADRGGARLARERARPRCARPVRHPTAPERPHGPAGRGHRGGAPGAGRRSPVALQPARRSARTSMRNGPTICAPS